MSAEPRTPPYASYVSFTNFLQSLKAHPLPDRIDKSVMSHLNHGTRMALVGALKALSLMKEDGTPTDVLTQLVQADEAERKPLLAKILKSTFPYLWDGTINLDRATSEQLVERIRTEGKVNGSTVGKVVNFFLLAAADAGIPLSPHLSKGKPSATTNGGGKRAKAKRSTRPAHTEHSNGHGIPKSPISASSDPVAHLMDKFPTFDPTWPDNLKTEWFKGFEGLMDRVKPRVSRKVEGTKK